MGPIKRGVKNAFRNVTRTVAIVFILSVSICLALVMLLSMKTVTSKIESVKSSVGNTVTVTPAGVRGFEGGGNLLTTTDAKGVEGTPHVLNIVQLLNDRLTPGTDTTLQASLTAGSFGNRQRQQQTPQPGDANVPSGRTRNFTPPITVTGTNCLGNFAALNLTSLSLTSGQTFDVNSADKVVLIGKDLAAKNNLGIGSTFAAYNDNLKVIGIFDGGNTFANSSILMPLATVQNLSSQSGSVSSMIVTVDSVDNLDSVKTTISSKLGAAADVTTSQEQVNQIIQPLESIHTISFYSLVGSLVAGAIIIFLTMLMIVRERRKEIGVLKAIGGSNFIITTQFMVESLVLTLMASVIGIVGGIYLSNPILNAMVSGSSGSNGQTAAGRFGGGGAIRAAGVGLRATFSTLHAVVGYDLILYGLLAAVVIAVIGSAIPAYMLSKIRPAEVMRAD